MCWNRGGAEDYNTWESLGNPGWGWQSLLPYFMKVSCLISQTSFISSIISDGVLCSIGLGLPNSCLQSETYTPVYSTEIANRFSINYNPAVHGHNGPVQVSYPRYFYDQSSEHPMLCVLPLALPLTHYSVNLFSALNLLGVPTEFDPNDGTSAGAAFIPTDIDPVNQTRSDARRAYYDPYASRPNFHVITGQQVTRILVDSVSGTTAADTPSTGGDVNGQGMVTNGVSGGLFGVGYSTPPPTVDGTGTGTSTGTRSKARDLPSGLRITGVEVSIHHTQYIPHGLKLIVCTQCGRSKTERHSYTRSHRNGWLATLGSTASALGYWTPGATR